MASARQAADSTTFRDKPITTIRPSHIHEWIKTLSQPAESRNAGLAPSTSKTRFNYVHMAFRAVVVDRVIASDPSHGAVLPRVRRAEAAMAIPSTQEVAAALGALTDMIAQHIQDISVRGDERWLFSAGGALLDRNTAGHYWRRAREAAGLGECTLRDLRHFFASALIASECDVATVQRALRHSSATVTPGVYAHLWPSAEDRQGPQPPG